MGKSSPSAPPAPDYAGAAAAQGAANVESARLAGRMSNPNIYGPLGSQTVTWGEGTPKFNQTAYDQANQAYNQQLQQYNATGGRGGIISYGGESGDIPNYGQGGGVAPIAPTREQYTTTTPNDQPTVTQTLTPDAMATLQAQQSVQKNLANLGLQGIGTASNVLGKSFNPNLPGIQTNLGNAGQIPQTPDLSSYGQASGLQGKQPPAGFNGGRSTGFPSQDRMLPDGSGVSGFPSQDRMLPDGSGVSGFNNQPRGNLAQAPQAPELSVYGMAGSNVNAQPVNQGPQAGQYGMAGAGPSAGQYGFAGGLNTSNVAAMPVNAGMTGQQAIMNRLAPQLERADAATRQRLVNQGLVPGGEAYENAMISQNQQKNDLLSQAALQGIGLDTAANAQGFGQALQAGQYGNQAIAQNFNQGQAANAAQNAAVGQNFNQGLAAQQAQNAALQQLYNQNMGVQGLQNQAIGQNQQTALAQYQAQLGGQQQGFGQQVTQRQLGNQAISQNQQTALAQQQAALAAQNQQYNQLLQGGQFGNTAQQQSLQQQLALRNQPLNEIAGLMGGSQIQMPQFQGYQGQNVAPAPVMAGAQAQNQAAMQNYGIQSSNVNAQNAGLYGLLGAGAQAAGMAGMFSDRRLKSNIERVGTHPLGIGIYEYDIFGERQRGVMADEVEQVMPDAVIEHPSGFKMVNYGALQ